MKIKDKYKGIFYIILAAFGFAFMNLFVKLAGDLPAIEKAFSAIWWQFSFPSGQ